MSYPNGMQAVYVQQLANALFIDQLRSTQINPVPKGNRLPRWQQLRNIAQHAHIVNNRPARGLPIGARLRGLKLPGVSRALPIAAVASALGVAEQVWYYLSTENPALEWQAPGYVLTSECDEPRIPNRIGYGVYAGFCARFSIDMSESGPGLASSYSVYQYQNTGYRWQVKYAYAWDGVSPRLSWDELHLRMPQALRPAPRTVAAPVPAPSVLPGRYISPRQVMPEWPDAGYDVAPDSKYDYPEPKYLRSRRPGPNERERKVRIKDFAIGRTLEWLVSQATEGLDFQRALFEALPWWRKIALYKKARRLELQYDQGRIVRGRLHYVDLTPQAKMQAIYDYIDEIDVAQAVENAIKQQLTDMLWAEIGQRMGRYQVGPWDDHGYMGPEEEPDWEYYVPDTAPDTAHNHWTYETLVNRRLTRREAERIHRRYDQYRSQPYEG